jgi:mono/diheme cytochrome c family protein
MQRIRGVLSTALVVTLAAALGCGDDAPERAPATSPPQASPLPAPTPEPAPPPAPSAPATSGAEAGAQHYALLCASCHGPRGEGDGPQSAALDPKPAKHSDGAYMNAKSDDQLFDVIRNGGAANGLSPLMAPWGGALSDEQIRDVVAFIRTLADPPYEGG